ncbi:dual specificity phosphatase [Histoplasma capsulatum G186AR]|uniref:protein-tyrosine-phosphatase n=2 Tax=Ajellomyces capsulatus TaxID=5037 RepID=C0NIS0_AJECG|nr:dual specificity phosphatase [Histoplasma capsulatum G186AR]EEH08790.1 dual specificity phosphatase [Histoplasma capsulatum G186AR]KAG5303903.1 dual specificity phosphatase [Histoplasma capsulatum]QSS69501.1 dual specificity phosphatase [Histoplasma capsulatum G186AR]
MALSKIGDENLYLSGIMALSNESALKKANITHIVSVLRLNPDERRFESFEHLQIPVDDVSDEDLLEYFPTTNAFIKSGLDGGGGVLIHCAMGKSRSATVCIAYLIHRERGALTPWGALELIRQSRPLCEPNDGFQKQLELYHKMGCPECVTDHPLYKRWVYERAVEESVACGRAPEIELVRFEDEHADRANNNEEPTEIKCRKCRRKLATLPFIIPHAQKTDKQLPRGHSIPEGPCAHIFLHPLTWMRPSLFPEQTNSSPTRNSADEHKYTPEAPLSGRLTCPNSACGANVGKFAWQGMKCSCGNWVVPAIGLARARVDVVDGSVKRGTADPAAGIRLPATIGEAGGGGIQIAANSVGGRGLL